jgi:hypothetical protein
MLKPGDRIALPDTSYVVEKVEYRYRWIREKRKRMRRTSYHLRIVDTSDIVIMDYKELYRMTIGVGE